MRVIQKTKVLNVLMVLMSLMPLVTTQAQVKIGQDAEPVKGTVLELNSNPGGYIGGLRLTNVSLASITDLTRLSETPSDVADLKGAIVYNTNPAIIGGNGTGVYYWDGAKWVKDAGATVDLDAWLTKGNAGTDASVNFIGTKDYQPLQFKIGNVSNVATHAGRLATTTTSFGFNALGKNTIGIRNTAVGVNALFSNTQGSSNTAVGDSALYKNTTGYGNAAVGYAALANNVNGFGNTAMGDSALQNSTGSSNTGVGYHALERNTAAGVRNTAMGAYALQGNASSSTGGTGNTAIGYAALRDKHSNSNYNTAIGDSALAKVSYSSNNNTAIGHKAGSEITNGKNNIAVGVNAQVYKNGSDTSSDHQLAIGKFIYGVTGDTEANAKVGIGTNNPTRKLHIDNGTTNGAIRIVDGTEGLNKVLASAADGTGTWKDPNTIIDAWFITGNSGTNSSNFIGTKDNQSLRFKVNNTHAGIIIPGKSSVAFGYNAGPKFDGSEAGNTAFGTNALAMSDYRQSHNTAIGYNTLANNFDTNLTWGNHNTAIGSNALAANKTGNYNTAVGSYALAAHAGYLYGGANTAIGSRALAKSTSGQDNTAVGNNALAVSDGVSYSTAVGSEALAANTNGSYNTAVGYKSLAANKTSHRNTSIGYEALTKSTAGWNTAVGYQALASDTTGTDNVALGVSALYWNGKGSYNVAVGVSALNSNRASSNTAVGYEAHCTIVNGEFNTALGYRAMGNGGSMSSEYTGSRNTAVGDSALYGITSGNRNVGIGVKAGSNIRSGHNNITIGVNAQVVGISNQISIANLIYATGATGEANTGNVGLGTNDPQARLHIVKGTSANGFILQDGITANPNNYVLTADAQGVGTWKPAGGAIEPWYKIGSSPAAPSTLNTDDSYLMAKVAIGANAIATVHENQAQLTVVGGDVSIQGITVGTGKGNDNTNTAVGRNTLSKLQPREATETEIAGASHEDRIGVTYGDGRYNLAFGSGTGWNITTGTGNIIMGSITDLSTGRFNTAIGCRSSVSPNDNHQISIHNLINATGATGVMHSNPAISDDYVGEGKVGIGTNRPKAKLHVMLTNGISKTYEPGFMLQDGSQEDGYVLTSNADGLAKWMEPNGTGSDRRLKTNITPSKYGLSEIMKLQPVNYELISKPGVERVGFIAQEVKQIIPEVVLGTEGDLEKGETLSVVYGEFAPVLTKAIQEQQTQIESLLNLVESQQKIIEQLEARLKALETAK
ncbi:MAG: tail fiber domain-containing protein [Dysgonamonadaceae bacterium]|jgi:hypothetical protein|nr:tail fiber domain-containing protein [Dysgonamonadaceae bacterium]